VVLSEQPGWAWAPVDRYDQEGEVYPLDQRSAARAAVARLAAEGFSARMAFEVEWALSTPPPHGEDTFTSAVRGPAYGHARVVQESDYLRDVVTALRAQGVAVEQIHPEYAEGQFELSVAARDPVSAADDLVLVRETIRAISVRYGLRATFAPKVLADGVGNGGHVHLSLWRGEANTFSGGDGRFGLTSTAEAFTAGILNRLPGLLAIGAPSVASYLRLVPQHWAGAYQTWGWENREAGLRLITGATGSRAWAANLEVKCFDQAANPYLVVAGLIFAGLAGVARGTSLPEPVDVDPATVDASVRRIARLPESLVESVDAFEADDVLVEGFGEHLASTLVDVRRGEIAHFADSAPEAVVAALRWVY
jgi:glutamine synthetase